MPAVRAVVLAFGLAPLLIAVPAWSGVPGDYGEAVAQCTITDPQIDELSGLVALSDGQLLLVEDSTPEPRRGSTSILMYRLDTDCTVQGDVAEFDQDPRDIEDLALRENTLWFADIGDNGANRESVALICVSYDPEDPLAGAGQPVVFRLAYPDGPHDAEALVLAPDGTPYLVTKEPLGHSAVYRPLRALDSTAEVLMEKVTDLDFVMTGTRGGPLGRAGQVLVTGGAVSADGSRIALRTYTDAYVWELSGSDVAGALAAEPQDVLPLPDAPQGEAISFAADSRSLVVGSEGVNSVITVIPAAPATPSAQAPDTQAVAAAETEPVGTSAFATSPTTAAAGLAVVALVFGVVWVVTRIRRKGN